MPTCFICFEDQEQGSEFKQLCPTCLGSTICSGCERDAMRVEDRFDVLSHCPMCRRQISDSVVGRVNLSTIWHPLTLLTWWLLGVDYGIWQQLIVLHMSHYYLSNVCRMVNRQHDNSRPTQLLRRWKFTVLVIHAPYVFLSLLDKTTRSSDTYINVYMASHILSPVFFQVTAYLAVKFNMFIRNLFPVRQVEV
jgi:hypothetical protein